MVTTMLMLVCQNPTMACSVACVVRINDLLCFSNSRSILSSTNSQHLRLIKKALPSDKKTYATYFPKGNPDRFLAFQLLTVISPNVLPGR